MWAFISIQTVICGNNILLNRLSEAGFSVPLLRFFSSYLVDRRQFVRLGNFISEPYFTQSGVSHGSNLRPLLFTILVNDIGCAVKTASCLLFADDMKVPNNYLWSRSHHFFAILPSRTELYWNFPISHGIHLVNHLTTVAPVWFVFYEWK